MDQQYAAPIRSGAEEDMAAQARRRNALKEELNEDLFKDGGVTEPRLDLVDQNEFEAWLQRKEGEIKAYVDQGATPQEKSERLEVVIGELAERASHGGGNAKLDITRELEERFRNLVESAGNE